MIGRKASSNRYDVRSGINQGRTSLSYLSDLRKSFEEHRPDPENFTGPEHYNAALCDYNEMLSTLDKMVRYVEREVGFFVSQYDFN
jgi:hypothetical protein